MAKQERRYFNRVQFQARIELSQGDNSWEGQIIDISLKGVLVALPDSSRFDQHQPAVGKIYLADDTGIQLTLRLAHSARGQLGFYCENIDVDSISHLRRLIELNTGDPAASERELSALVSH